MSSFGVMLLLIGGVCVFLYYLTKDRGRNIPTWNGIIISAILGLLPVYLILCFFGVMGEERNELG